MGHIYFLKVINFSNPTNYSYIKDFFTFLLTAIGIIIAGKGLSAWKKQIEGSKKFETSYNLNYSVLKLRDAIAHVRNPAIWNPEFDKAAQYIKNKYPERPIDLEKNSNIYVYEMRWEEITRAYTEMESHLLSAEVLWGSEVLDKVRPLKKQVSKLSSSLQQYLIPEFRLNHKDLFEVVYDGSNEKSKDAFSQEIDKCVEEIKDYIKRKL